MDRVNMEDNFPKYNPNLDPDSSSHMSTRSK